MSGMVDLGLIQAALSLNLAPFMTGIKAAQSQLQNLGTQFGGSLNGVSGSISNMNNQLNKTKDSMKDINRIVGGILISQAFYQGMQAIEGATKSLMGFMNNMEKAQIAMEYFLGTPEKAKGFITVMKDFAAETSFSTEQALLLSRRLMAAQFKPEQIKGIMEIMNDASAATGGTAEQMDRIVLALTQMKTNGKIAGQEVRQLAEANIPIYKILQDELGLSAKQLSHIGDYAISGAKGVEAVLTWMEKNYKGAARRIANTMGGMWETIKDDTLMVSDYVFDKPFGALEGFVRKWRDTMEKARNIVTEKGVGGLFQNFIPPELQVSIKAIMASIQSLAKSFGVLMQAIGPIVKLALAQMTMALSNILPVIAMVVSWIANFIKAAVEASPVIRLLGAAILTLMVASTAAKALLLLWNVTRMGVIAAAVAQAVTLLRNAILMLYAAATRNPVVGILTAIAAALLYIGTSSKTVSAWLDKVTTQVANLAGFNLGGMFKEDSNTSIDDWIKQFNESLTGTTQGLKDVGKTAAATGKKVKDKFVASFDELYQVPDLLDNTDDSLGDVGDTALNLPQITVPTINTSGLTDKDGGLPGIYPPGGPPTQGPKLPPDDNWKDTPPPAVVAGIGELSVSMQKLRDSFRESGEEATVWGRVLTTAIDTVFVPVNAGIALLKSMAGGFTSLGNTLVEWGGETVVNMAQWGVNFGVAVGDGMRAAVNAIGTWIVQAPVAIATGTKAMEATTTTWAQNTATAVVKWVDSTVHSIGEWATNVGVTVAGMGVNTVKVLTQWSIDAYSQVSGWVTNTVSSFTSWVSNVDRAFDEWSSSVASIVVTWVGNTTSSLEAWALDRYNAFVTWSTDAGSTFVTWSKNTISTVSSWIDNTSTNLSEWAVNTSDNIANWATNVVTNIGNWAVDASKAVSDWVSNTSSSIYNWAVNTSSNIGAWITSTAQAVGSWVTQTSKAFADWVTGTSQGVANWATNVATNLAAFANAGVDAIGSFAKGAWTAMSNWLKGTASGVYSWAQSTIGTIVSWAQSAWSAISSLAAAVGQTLGFWSASVSNSVTSAYNGMADFAENYKSEIVAALAVTAVVGAGVATVMTGGMAAPALAAALVAAPIAIGSTSNFGGIAQYATGGIIDTDQIARIGEGNKREAIIPLENEGYMRPFSAAVASDLAQMLGQQETVASPMESRPIMYVGTLIADDKSLKELYRKMDVIRIAEQQRKGLS